MEPEGVIESNWNEVVDNFDDMNLKEELLRGIYAYGFERPSAIQQRAILPCIKEHDVIAQAQSGKFYSVTFAHNSICISWNKGNSKSNMANSHNFLAKYEFSISVIG